MLFQQSNGGVARFVGLGFASRQVVLTAVRGVLYKITFLGVYESHPIATPAADRASANRICSAGSSLHMLRRAIVLFRAFAL
jgi:hypothetical protein